MDAVGSLSLSTVIEWLGGLVAAFGGIVIHDLRERVVRIEHTAMQNSEDIVYIAAIQDIELPSRRR